METRTSALVNYQLKSNGELTYVHFPHLPVPHGSSTRLGGVSQGAYASLNLGYTAGDDPEVVGRNRRLFGQALGFEVPWTLSMNHGVQVAVLTEPSRPDRRQPGDACITDVPGVGMSITTADCVPILFYDPGRPAVGLAHAGWRGTVGGIAAATAAAMAENYGSRPEDLQVGIAPAIGPEAFLVHGDVAEPFQRRFPGRDWIKQVEDRWSIDLWHANYEVLLEYGVPAENIRVSRLCTSEREDLFFSYRRDQRHTGRLATAICLP